MKEPVSEKILYLDCSSGISGDMFLAALLDAGLNQKKLVEKISKVLPKNIRIKVRREKRRGFTGKRFQIENVDDKIERGLKGIKKLLKDSGLSKEITRKSLEMFDELAEIEAEIHGIKKENIHFHELGAIDSIADIVGAVAGVKLLGIEKTYSSKVNIGSGTTEIKHGRVPLPVPATTELLRRCGAPIYSTGMETELVTPTGALILKHFVDSFEIPEMRILAIGRGFGAKEFKKSHNFLRVLIGTTQKEWSEEEVLLETNIDNMNPEFYPTIEEKLLSAGALDFYKTPIQMKKGRPGIKISIICTRKDIDKLSEILFRETTTLGIRIQKILRRKLERKIRKVKTEFGEVEVKMAYLNGELVNFSPEYESCKRLAEKTGIPLKMVYEKAKESFILQTSS